jgi:hypothetical protein
VRQYGEQFRQAPRRQRRLRRRNRRPSSSRSYNLPEIARFSKHISAS